MTAVKSQKFRKIRRVFSYGLFVLLIMMAFLVGLINQALPIIEDHPKEISDWLAQRAGVPVSFTDLEAQWTRRGPRLRLQGLRIGEGAEQVDIGRADLLIAIYSGLFPTQPLTEIKVRDFELSLIEDSDRGWRLEGVRTGGTGADPLEALEGFGEIQIEHARLRLKSEPYGIDQQLPRVDLRLRVYGNRLLAGASAYFSEQGKPISVVADMQREKATGTLWLGADHFDFADISPWLSTWAVRIDGGSGSLNVWADIDDRKLSSLRVDADATQVKVTSLRGIAEADAQSQERSLTLDQLNLISLLRLRDATHWDWQAPLLRAEIDGRKQNLNGISVQRSQKLHINAPELDVATLLHIVTLSGALDGGLQERLQELKPTARLLDLEMHFSELSDFSGEVSIHQLGIDALGDRPGLQGLGGHLSFDHSGAVIDLDPAPVTFDWQPAFGELREFRLSGQLALWHDAGNWHVQSDQLGLESGDLKTVSRFESVIPSDQSKPEIYLATQIAPLDITQAKRYWIRHKMTEKLQDWLNNGLISGRIDGASVLMAGDLDQWPFQNAGGMFEARAKIADLSLKFHSGWPQADKLNLDVLFNGTGMLTSGAGSLLDNEIKLVRGDIPTFKQPILLLDVSSDTNALTLRKLLIQSPLYAKQKKVLDSLSIAGGTKVSSSLSIPLRSDLGSVSINGVADLLRARVFHRGIKQSFSGLSGRIHFSESGMSAQELSVRYRNQLGALSLMVGSASTNPGHAWELLLQGDFSIESLLAVHPPLKRINQYIAGKSTWSINAHAMPAGKDADPVPVVLNFRSDLIGSELKLPAPLKKSASTAWPLSLTLNYPLSADLVTLQLGELLKARARFDDKGSLTASVFDFGATEKQPLPQSGIAVSGFVSVLDVLPWTDLKLSDDDAPVLEKSINLSAGSMILFGASFSDVNLQLEQAKVGGQSIGFSGVGLEGDLSLPDDSREPVKGNFKRIYWPAFDPSLLTEVRSEAEQLEQRASFNPAAIPPLQFLINDLRLGDVRYGDALLSTFPTPEGMHIDKFESKSKELDIKASGDWTRIGGATRSRFQADIQARNLGDMLDALGFTGMVNNGAIKATMQGDWPGSPDAFELDKFDGRLEFSVGKGQLLQIEPGGSGRLLGLLSIAEIPRRLSLNFSDLFSKGFAFNSMQGSFDFDKGLATTDNLAIKGPSAEINVRGTTDLKAQTYDQVIEVLPKAGGMLTAIGGVVGGPAGAALGTVAQAVLQKPLKQAGRTVYSVQGPWAEPEIKVIEKGAPKDEEQPVVTADSSDPS